MNLMCYGCVAENFREAKKLKLVIEELSRAGEVLCRYEVEKKQAIDREDYDTAKIKKVKSVEFPPTPIVMIP